MTIQLNPFSWIPSGLKKQVADNVLDFLGNLAGKTVNDEFGDRIKKLKSDGDFQKAIDAGIVRAAERFTNEYGQEDEDLVAAISSDGKFWQAKSVRDALVTILQHPGHLEEKDQETIAKHFDDVLPQRVNRKRVDRAATFFLRCLAEEVWHLPELRPIYDLQLQRISVDRAEAMLHEVQGMRSDFQQAMLALAHGLDEQRKLLGAGSTLALPDLPKVLHNLPNPDYVNFIGREAERARLRELLSPDNRTWVIVIDGIGGIGKSTLALEIAHEYLRNFNTLSEEERFETIIWTSAKAMTLTADGIMPRQQITRTLSDIYTTISIALEREDITRARPEEQDDLVRRALTQQRTLLIIDNMETIDDERVNAFLSELPSPTKCIVTTRHRIDVAYPIRLSEMPRQDALNLIAQECEKKNVTLNNDEADLLYRRTGGVPLALVWSIAQMGYGNRIEAVLRRLGNADDKVAQYSFKGALDLIKGKPAHKLLMALSIFIDNASRIALGYIADLSAIDRDEGLVQLERLSLVNKNRDRFAFLPLTRTFAFAELTRDSDVESKLRRRWIDYLKEITRGADSEYYWRYASYAFYDEGENILDALKWAYANEFPVNDIFGPLSAAYDFLEVTGRWNEIQELCRPGLRLATSVQNHVVIARLSNIIGWIYQQRGEYDSADDLYKDAIIHYRKIDNREGESVTLQHLSAIYRKRGDFAKSKDLCDEAWQIAVDLDIGDLKALIKTAYGKLARDMGEWELAWNYFSEVKDWFEKRTEQAPRDEPLARSTWGHLAIVAYHLGRPQEAKELCLKSLDFFEQYGTKGYMATLKYRLALAEEALGETDNALRDVQEALTWFDRLGMKPDYTEAAKLLQRLQSRPSSAN